MMLHDYLKEKGVRDNVEIIYTYPTKAQVVENGLFLQTPTSEVLPTVFDSIGVKHKRSFTLSKVDPNKKNCIF